MAELDSLYSGHWRKMTTLRDGKEYVGYWVLSDDEVDEALLTVTVCLASLRTSAQLGGMRPEGLARQLLDRLIDGAEAQAKTS